MSEEKKHRKSELEMWTELNEILERKLKEKKAQISFICLSGNIKYF